ncbi:MAG: HD domain-containing protein, partial [Nitrospirae bacterium]
STPSHVERIDSSGHEVQGFPPESDLRAQRIQAFEHRRRQLLDAERRYQEVLLENKTLMREVLCGYVRGMRRAEQLLMVLADIVCNDGALVALMNLMGTQDIGDEFFYHSLNTAILSMVVARALEFSQDDVHTVGMGALFHDIGETTDTGEILYKGGNLSRKQREALRRHPQVGKRMVEKGFNFPQPGLDIILQHHERLNGCGYPYGLTDEQIHLFTKVVMVADTYDDLCNNPVLEKSLTPYEAMCALYARRRSEFWEEAVVAMIGSLGVYPPSSVVELSNGAIGVVCTINPENRLRPLVLLYEPHTPRQEALILNLMEEPTLHIKRGLRPSQLPRDVWDYLNPRNMIRYFAYTPTEPQTPAI